MVKTCGFEEATICFGIVLLLWSSSEPLLCSKCFFWTDGSAFEEGGTFALGKWFFATGIEALFCIEATGILEGWGFGPAGLPGPIPLLL